MKTGYEYGVYYLFDESKKPFAPIRILKPNEVKRIIDALDVIHDFEYYRRKKLEVELNLKELSCVILKYKQKVVNITSEEIESDFRTEIFVDVNRAMTNLISSLKIFVDHFDKRLAAKLGKQSTKFAEFKTQLSLIYDTVEGYKILINLRDFSQHKKYFPVNHINVVKDTNDLKSRKGFYLEISFDKNQLLEDEKLKTKLGGTLRYYNELFPVEPILNQVEGAIPQILELFVQAEYDYYTKAANTLLSFVNENNSHSKTGYGKILKQTDTIDYLSSTSIPLDIIEHLRGITLSLEAKGKTK